MLQAVPRPLALCLETSLRPQAVEPAKGKGSFWSRLSVIKKKDGGDQGSFLVEESTRSHRRKKMTQDRSRHGTGMWVSVSLSHVQLVPRE